MKRMTNLAFIFVAAVFLVALAQLGEARAKKINIENIPEWKVKSADVSGTLIFSDSPEIVPKDGILYEDTVKGKARLLYYHLNGTKALKKIVAVLENPTDQDINITITNYGMGGPSEDYLHVGKTTQEQYFNGKKIAFVHVPAKGRRLLSPKFDEIIVQPEKLVYGVFDFESPSPVKVSVMMMPSTADPLKFIDRARVLPADKSHLRGTFTGMDRIIKAEQIYDGKRDGAVAVTLADGKKDLYRTGIDATDNSIVENYGNYGVLYQVHIPTTGVGSTKYYLNPCGGVYAGALGIRRGVYGGYQMISTPSDKAFFGDGNRVTDITYLGEYRNTNSLWFEFSPPGASNLPARLILMPAQG